MILQSSSLGWMVWNEGPLNLRPLEADRGLMFRRSTVLWRAHKGVCGMFTYQRLRHKFLRSTWKRVYERVER